MLINFALQFRHNMLGYQRRVDVSGDNRKMSGKTDNLVKAIKRIFLMYLEDHGRSYYQLAVLCERISGKSM